MVTLRQLRPKAYKNYKGIVGLEIETESRNAWVVPTLTYWSGKLDGSLRNQGIEFVLKEPLSPNTKSYTDALHEFSGLSQLTKFIEDSTYTSVHVHLNVLDMDLIHVANLITLYVIFENVLTRYCGNDRNGNLFCLKTSDAEVSYQNYRDLIKAIDEGRGSQYINGYLNEVHLKYSALNIATLRSFGSVEVRTHKGTTNIDEIDRWVQMLMCLYEAAKKYKDPVEVVKDFRDKSSFTPNTHSLFGPLAEYFALEKLDEDIGKCLYYAAALAGCIPNWKGFGERKAEQKKTSFTSTPIGFDEVVLFSHDRTEEQIDHFFHYNGFNDKSFASYNQSMAPIEDM